MTASSASSARPIAPVGRSRLNRRSVNSAIRSELAGFSSSPIAAVSVSIRSSCTPNTARTITSSVIARVRSCSRIGRPSGQPTMSRLVACTIVSSYSRMRSPWNGGSSSLRWRMCSLPVSTITELGPMIGAIGEFPAPDGATSGGAVNSAFTDSGSLTIASFIPLGANVSVNASPIRCAH
jgi:hypothetical protein